MINGLTEKSHPCQIMADLQTLEEAGLALKGARIAWVGDGNNVAASFIHAAPKFGFSLAIGTPEGYEPADIDVERARNEQGRIDLYHTAGEAAAGADVIVADTFVSMGDLDGKKRLKDLAPFKVTANLMRRAKKRGAIPSLSPGPSWRRGRSRGYRRANLARCSTRRRTASMPRRRFSNGASQAKLDRLASSRIKRHATPLAMARMTDATTPRSALAIAARYLRRR